MLLGTFGSGVQLAMPGTDVGLQVSQSSATHPLGYSCQPVAPISRGGDVTRRL